MKRNPAITAIVISSIFIACTNTEPELTSALSDGRPTLVCEPFDLDQVELLEGPFLRATMVNVQSLLRYDPDRLLAKFRIEAGLEPRADHYGGWEGMTLAGHSLGHYMSACALMYRTTGDPQFLEKVAYTVEELEECQESGGSGYMGAFPDGKRILEEEVGRGEIRAAPFNLNGIWAPFYTIHKVMAGLRDAYRLCNIEKALGIEREFGQWIWETLSGLSDDQIQEMLRCEHGGMNEVLADLFADTGDSTFLDLSYRFYHREILEPLAEGRDILSGKHGNTQIPKLIGLARRYEITGNPRERYAAEFFWDRVVNHHSYVNGSHGYHEYFGPPDSLNNRLGSSTSESCNVYNMLKLSEHLFAWNASPEVADFYELALINHILSSQHPEDGRVLYFHSLQMGGHKEYQDPYGFTCCVGTGMENHSQYGRAIFYKNENELYINQFIAARLTWKEKGLILRQETGFPEEQGTKLVFMNDQPVKLTLQLRIPSWADKEFSVRLNGRLIRKTMVPGTYLAIRKRWNKGDEIELQMPFALKRLSMPDNPGRIALKYGPLVLAGDLGPVEADPAGDPLFVPRIVSDQGDPHAWTIPAAGTANAFAIEAAGRTGDIMLRPLHTIHDRSYTVYWDLLTGEQWEELLEETEARRKALEELEGRTIDHMVPGPDRASMGHQFRAEDPGIYDFNGQHFIESRQGWFSFEMQMDPGKATGLMVDYWGGFRGPRKFVILVNGDTIATEDFSRLVPNEKNQVLYTIPARLTSKGSATIRFDGVENNYAGPVFGIRTISLEE